MASLVVCVWDSFFFLILTMTVNPAVFRKALYCVSGCIRGMALNHGLKIMYSLCFPSPTSTSEQITVTKEVSEITGISQLKVISTLGNQFPSKETGGGARTNCTRIPCVRKSACWLCSGRIHTSFAMSGMQSRSYGNSSRKTLKTG